MYENCYHEQDHVILSSNANLQRRANNVEKNILLVHFTYYELCKINTEDTLNAKLPYVKIILLIVSKKYVRRVSWE